MKIFISGGAGFIGSHIVAELIKEHDIIIGGRNTASMQRRFPKASVLACDFTKDTNKAIWLKRLAGVDAVVNCVGILHSLKPSTIKAVHYETPKAMFEACQELGIKNIIQFSAIGTEETRHIHYADTKKALDDFLLSSGLNATIIRPSFVYSDVSYGGSSLFRGLAAMPGFIPVVGSGEQRFQPIHAEDLAKMIGNLLKAPSTPKVLYAVGPDTINLKELLQSLRGWLGFKKAPIIKTPLFFLKWLSPLGSLLPWWPVNATTVGMMQFPDIAVAKPEALNELVQATSMRPKGWYEALSCRPSGVQDRWHAQLYFMHPLIRIALATIWIARGLVSLLNRPLSYFLLRLSGIPFAIQKPILYSTSFLDIIIGIWVLTGIKSKLSNWVQGLLIIAYSGALTLLMPNIWLDPFGPLLKNIALLALVLVLSVIGQER